MGTGAGRAVSAARRLLPWPRLPGAARRRRRSPVDKVIRLKTTGVMATIQEALTIALDHHQAGRPAEAEILCRRILDADPDQAASWHLLGIVHAQDGRFAEAAALLGEALARAPGPDLHLHRAMARQEAGDLEGAVADYRKAARLNPALADASLNAGMLLERLRRTGEALETYRSALDRDGGNARAANNLGRLLLAGGDAAKAATILERAVRESRRGRSRVPSRARSGAGSLRHSRPRAGQRG